MDSLHDELQFACDLAREAGALARQYFWRWHDPKRLSTEEVVGVVPVEFKAEDDPVTEADHAVNTMCVNGLRARFPDDAVLSEELPDDGARRRARRTWLVDPIDGTKDFIAGRPGFSVMIGLLVAGAPALGVVYQPLGDRLWYATIGHGAFGRAGDGPPSRLQVSTVSVLSEARMVSSASHPDPMVAEVRVRSGIQDELQIGSVGIKLSLVAEGVRDLYINPAGRTKLWDTGAPEIILREAGGQLSDLFGGTLEYSGEELGNLHGLVGSNGLLHEAALVQLQPLVAALRTRGGKKS